MGTSSNVVIPMMRGEESWRSIQEMFNSRENGNILQTRQQDSIRDSTKT